MVYGFDMGLHTGLSVAIVGWIVGWVPPLVFYLEFKVTPWVKGVLTWCREWPRTCPQFPPPASSDWDIDGGWMGGKNDSAHFGRRLLSLLQR